MFQTALYRKYFYFFLLVSIIPMLLIYFVTYHILANGMINQMREKENEILIGYKNKIDLTLKNVDAIAVQLANSYTNYGNSGDPFNSIPPYEKARILQSNNSVLLANDYIKSIYIYFFNSQRFIVNDYFDDWDTFYDKDWINLYNNYPTDNTKKLSVLLPKRSYQDSILTKSSDLTITSLIRPFPIALDPKIGYVVLNVNKEKLLQNFIDLQQEDYYIFSPQKEIIYGDEVIAKTIIKNANHHGFTKINDKKKYIFSVTSTYNQWEYVSIIDEDKLLGPLKALKNMMYFILAFCTFMSTALSAIVSGKFYKPIANFFESVKHVITPNSMHSVTDLSDDGFSVLQESIKEYIQKSTLIEDEYNQSKELIHDVKIRKLLRNEGNILSDENIKGILGNENQSFVVCTIHNYAEEFTSRNSKDFCSFIKQIVSNEIGESDHYVIIDIDTYIVSIILCSPREYFFREHSNLLYELFHNIYNSSIATCEHICIGIGEPVNDISDISKSYLSSFSALKYRIFIEDRSIAFYSDIPKSDSMAPFFYPMDLESQLITAVKERNLDKVEGLVNDIIVSITQHNIDVDYIYSCFDSLNNAIFRIPASMGYNFDEIFFRDYRAVLKKYKYAKNLSQISDYFIEVCKNIIEGLNIKQTNKNTDLIVDIKQYIVDHIGEDVSLNHVAQYYGISSAYLSTIFKRETGENFIKYVLSIRMKMAEKLITETNLTVKEISEKIGYLDEHSFYNSFKKYYGHTASQYRNMIRTATNKSS